MDLLDTPRASHLRAIRWLRDRRWSQGKYYLNIKQVRNLGSEFLLFGQGKVQPCLYVRIFVDHIPLKMWAE